MSGIGILTNKNFVHRCASRYLHDTSPQPVAHPNASFYQCYTYATPNNFFAIAIVRDCDAVFLIKLQDQNV